MADRLAAHEEFRISLGAYVLGAMQDEERCRELEAHLRECRPCRDESLKLADAATRLSTQGEDSGPDVWKQIRQRITGQDEDS